MKRAGCRILQIGVETVENEVLEKLNRKNSLDRIQEVFTVSREEQILTMATVVLGLPGSSEEGMRKTVDFLLELDPDYASFNIMTPLLGSKLRAQWEELGYIGPEEYDIQDSTRAAFGHLGISPEHLTKIRDDAIRRFYFRPSYLLKRLRYSNSMRQILNETKTGLSLFLRHILRNSE
jgi:radical SAM superfamily enzyme YgiQ (UPF0313 family)